MRKLVSYRKIVDIKPITGADFIELALVDGWQCVVKKGEFKVGQTAVYHEVDSFLPTGGVYEFLRKTSTKKMGDEEGFRLKSIRLKSELSQGLLLPLSALGLTGDDPEDELAEILHVKLYEPPIPAELSGIAKGNFPSFTPKTDQERVQNLTGKIWGKGVTIEYIDADGNLVTKEIPPAAPRKYEVSEKLDGSSCTLYHNSGAFGVCSRNLELEENETNTYWKVVNQYSLKERLPATGRNVSLQGELVGEGIQGNPYKLKGQDLFIFDIFDIDKQAYFNPEERNKFLTVNLPDLKTVPILHRCFDLPDTLDELLLFVQGKSVLNDKTNREGLVFKEEDVCAHTRFSFKGISNQYLLAQKD